MGGPLLYSEIENAQQLHPEYKTIPNFVETGTYKADTTLMAATHFSHVYTTEINEQLYNFSRKRAAEEKRTNITFLLGDSVQLLSTITPKITEGAVFFIDAHQSGPDTSNNGKNVPLLDELDVILSHQLGPSVFIFDDTRFWPEHSTPAWDWTDIKVETVLNKFFSNGYQVDKLYEENDRFFVLAQYRK